MHTLPRLQPGKRATLIWTNESRTRQSSNYTYVVRISVSSKRKRGNCCLSLSLLNEPHGLEFKVLLVKHGKHITKEAKAFKGPLAVAARTRTTKTKKEVSKSTKTTIGFGVERLFQHFGGQLKAAHSHLKESGQNKRLVSISDGIAPTCFVKQEAAQVKVEVKQETIVQKTKTRVQRNKSPSSSAPRKMDMGAHQKRTTPVRVKRESPRTPTTSNPVRSKRLRSRRGPN